MKKLIILIVCCFSSFLFSQNADKKTDFTIIEKGPIHPECNEAFSNSAIKRCLAEKISELISKEFNTDLALNLGLIGRQRINVSFRINQTGAVVNTKATGPHTSLEQEAIRVINLLPTFKPGHQRGEPVTVPYTIPIIFEVEAPKRPIERVTKKGSNNINQPDSFPVFRNCKENLRNDFLKECTTEKIIDFIKVSFDTELASNLFPQKQSTRFKVEFIVNKKGKIEQVSAKANHREIAAEAIRVLKRIPKFKKPGYSNGEAIDTPFSIMMTVHLQEF